jgi:histidinol phosphatase-like PHP family hydrolase
MWLAADERVTILGHPWYMGKAIWYEDFDVIPRSMKLDIANELKKNGKYVECNSHFFLTPKATEKFRNQYAEYLREMFEMGIPVTYGSDSHKNYPDARPAVEKYLSEVGFKEGDFSEIAEKDLW